jgi:hypothetical protein
MEHFKALHRKLSTFGRIWRAFKKMARAVFSSKEGRHRYKILDSNVDYKNVS